MKKARRSPRFFLGHPHQLRSAFAFFEEDFAVLLLPLDIVSELPLVLGAADAVEPELVLGEAAVAAELLPEVVPCAAAPVLPEPGVPVWPMGVFWVLRWPAPTAGSAAGFGGVPWAKARLKVAAVTAATTIFKDMSGLLGLLGFGSTPAHAGQPRVGSRR